MQATEPTWNDQRMDEFADRTEENFREVRSEIGAVRTELRAEIRDVRSEIHTEVSGLRNEMNVRFGQLEGAMNRRFDILFGALATGFVGAVVTHFLG